MPQCKRNYCREPAADRMKVRGPYKQYCEKHLEEYQRRRRDELKRRAALPECDNKVSQSRVDAGMVLCADCQCEADRVKEADAALQRCRERDQRKSDELQGAMSVGELKAWIRKWVL